METVYSKGTNVIVDSVRTWRPSVGDVTTLDVNKEEEEEEENFILSRFEVQQITLACVTLLLRLCILTIWLR